MEMDDERTSRDVLDMISSRFARLALSALPLFIVHVRRGVAIAVSPMGAFLAAVEPVLV